MHRFFSDPSRSTAAEVFLTEVDARHAVTVLRLKPGSLIEVIRDASLWQARILSAAGSDVRAEILSPLPSTEPALSITLFQGLPKGDKMDFIVQKATEAGVKRIVPVLMNRCVAKPDQKLLAHRMERWKRIIRESAKQSGRCIVPELDTMTTIRDLVRSDSLPVSCVVPWEETDSVGPLSFCRSHPDLVSLGILIGPEGGIEQQEISLLQTKGFIPITLGKRILRTETAGLVAVSAFMSLCGEME